MADQKLSYIYAISAVLLWSTVATAFKVALRSLSPVELLLYSSLSALLFLSSLILLQKKVAQTIEYFKRHFFIILVLGAINPFTYYLVLFKAYDLLPAQEAQAINYTWALMLSYLSVIFLKHRLSVYDIIAGFMAYFGVLIISTKGDITSLHFSNDLGLFLALLSTVLWSFYWIFNTKIKVDPVISLFCNFLTGVTFIMIYFATYEKFRNIGFEGIASSIYVGLFEMGITFILWLKALKYSENTSKTANLIFLSPLLSLVFIHYIAGEKIENSTIVALIFILMGLSIQKIKTKEKHAKNI
jgi:drug/metabolite transporter (DMT)-like permease